MPNLSGSIVVADQKPQLAYPLPKNSHIKRFLKAVFIEQGVTVKDECCQALYITLHDREVKAYLIKL